MAKFYGQLEGQAQTIATRRGSTKSGIKVSAQSWDNSVILYMTEGKEGKPRIRIEIAEESGFYGKEFFDGYVEELKAILSQNR